MTKKKDVGLIIQFDDKEYSKEETEFLWEKFFLLLAEIQNIKIDPKIVENTTKAMVSEGPRIEQIIIPKEFIGAVIGPGGKIIQIGRAHV